MKRSSPFACLLAVLAASVAIPTSRAEDWKPDPAQIMTRWAKNVDPARPLPEYPRPQLVREGWTNLNGLWDYAITAGDATQPQAFEGKILVPYPIESALSGVRKALKPDQRLWYRREMPVLKLPPGTRLLLHFGAVDWDARVMVNDKEVGAHQGGYDGFTCDVTDALNADGSNVLVVGVKDATGGIQPCGKQSLAAVEKPAGIWYTPTSGIWQTVWTEIVPPDHVESLQITPDIDKRQVVVRVKAAGNTATATGAPVTVRVSEGGKIVAEGIGLPGKEIPLAIPDARLWSPEQPFLYDLKVTCGPDAVTSYFGMRKIGLDKDAGGRTHLFLNDKPLFFSGPLDQGFWPDGIYTAPTDEALRFDIETTKKLGFNGTRKHIKVEPDRWYYWCDKLGLLVWQDMPSGNEIARGTSNKAEGTAASPEAAGEFIKEMTAMYEGRRNHPAIVIWTVFNESWGQHDTVKLTTLMKSLDPTRIVDDASGWADYPVGDLSDMHKYPGPGSPKPEEKRAAVLGEFGGLGLPIPDHMWTEKSWGYKGVEDQAALTTRYDDLWANVRKLEDDPGLSAAIYTQLTDVETEANGLLTYDRAVVKVNVEQAAAAVAATRSAAGSK